MGLTTLSGRLVLDEGIVAGHLAFGARIEDVEAHRVLSGPEAIPRTSQPESARGPTGPAAGDGWILPGFVDLHVHGGGGGDAMQGEASVRRLCSLHGGHGTTALLPTTVTSPPEELIAALHGIRAVREAPRRGEAAVLGAHVEGPFVAPDRLGAQPPYARLPEPDEVEALLSTEVVRVITVAPEIAPAEELIRPFVEAGVRVQVGHTSANYDETLSALRSGATGFTHLFNAMSGLHHRDPGAAGAALAHAEAAELIVDLRHLAPGAVRLARRAIPSIYAVTDAVSATGMPDGRYPLGDGTVTLRGGRTRLEDGTLAGSTLTMDRALRNLLSIGLDLAEAVQWVSTRPARRLGLTDRGRIAPGSRADLVVLDDRLRVQRVFIGGEEIEAANATESVAGAG